MLGDATNYHEHHGKEVFYSPTPTLENSSKLNERDVRLLPNSLHRFMMQS
jgi:hypothetical protein